MPAIPRPLFVVPPTSGAGAVVGHHDLEFSIGARQGDIDAGRACVLERIGERLLHDSVRGDTDVAIDRMIAELREVDVGTGGTQLVDERGDVGRAVNRGEGSRVIVQQAEHVVEVGQRAAAGVLDVAERVDGSGVVTGEAGSSGAQHHDIDGVADGVVEFAGDAHALVGDRTLGDPVLFVAQVQRLHRQPARTDLVLAHDQCHHPAHTDEHRGHWQHQPFGVAGAVEHHGGQQRGVDGHDRSGDVGGTGHADRIGEERHGEQGVGVALRCAGDHVQRGRNGEYPERSEATQRQQQRRADCEPPANAFDGAELIDVGVAGERADGDPHEHQRQ